MYKREGNSVYTDSKVTATCPDELSAILVWSALRARGKWMVSLVKKFHEMCHDATPTEVWRRLCTEEELIDSEKYELWMMILETINK